MLGKTRIYALIEPNVGLVKAHEVAPALTSFHICLQYITVSIAQSRETFFLVQKYVSDLPAAKLSLIE